MELNHQWVKKTNNIDSEYLESTIKDIKLLKKRGNSNDQICDSLNNNGIYTTRGKLWNKHTLIKFRNKYITNETIPKQ